MHFTKIASLLASATMVLAENIITLKSYDSVARTVYFTPNPGMRWPEPVKVPAGKSIDVTIDQGWVGNLYAVHEGKANKPGMLAEFAFNSWGGLTYFDVSAIVDPTDVDNVSEIFPAAKPASPVSGCGAKTPFPCNNAYYLPDDIQTKTSTQTHFIVTMGKNGAAKPKREEAEANTPNVARSFVLGKM